MRHTMYMIRGGGETSAPTGNLVLLPGMKPEITYSPATAHKSHRVPNALWPLTRETFFQRMDDMTEESDRRAAGVEDEIAAIEQFYEGGQR